MDQEAVGPKDAKGERAAQPTDIRSILLKANVLYQTGRLNEALQHYERASFLQPANPHVWTAKGRVLADLGRHKEAASSFSRSLSIINKGKSKIDIPMEGGRLRPLYPLHPK